MTALTIREAAEHFRRSSLKFRFALDREAKVLAEGGAAEARAMIGQEHEAWPALAPSTLADKERGGYATPAPLLREGGLRDSVHGEAETIGEHVAIIVGSTSAIAILHEQGTSKMPARPFLGLSIIKAEPAIHEALGELVRRAVTPGKSL